jgi:hypothetical protein
VPQTLAPQWQAAVLRWFPNRLKPLSKGYTLFTMANFDFSHQRSNSMQDDGEARPPPAKHTRKYSDADQASIIVLPM